jgi:hypothetical protein
VDHRARFKGWNLDPRWKEPELIWNGSNYDIVENPTVAKQGQRPIVANVGGPGSKTLIQFVENSEKQIIGEFLLYYI